MSPKGKGLFDVQVTQPTSVIPQKSWEFVRKEKEKQTRRLTFGIQVVIIYKVQKLMNIPQHLESRLAGSLGDLTGTLVNSFEGKKDPVDLAREDYRFYAENAVRDEKTDEYIRLAPFHEELIAALTDPNITFILCEAPRGSGKSSQANAWLTWMCSRNPNLWSILVAKSDDMSIRQLNGIEGILRSPEHQRVFGNLIPERGRFTYRTPWSDQQKVLVRSKFTRFPTFLAVGTESSLVSGMRSDILVVDDLIDLSTAMSPAKSEHVKEWFWHTLLPTRNPYSKTVIVGTPMTRGDLYEDIRTNMEGKSSFRYIHCPALTDVMVDGQQQLVSYWPERYPVEFLLRLREENYWSFQNQYMLERLDFTKALFKKEWLKYIWLDQIPKELTIFQGIDPNSGKDDLVVADYLAMATVGVDSDGVAYLLDLLYIKGDIETVVGSIRNKILEWHPRMVSVEIDANQNHFKRYLEDKLHVSLNPVSSKNVSKKERLLSMSNHFISGRILIAAVPGDDGDLSPLPSLVPFVDEWSSYPMVSHDDALDSVNIALSPIIGLSAAPASIIITRDGIIRSDNGEEIQQEESQSRTRQNHARDYNMFRPRIPSMLRR